MKYIIEIDDNPVRCSDGTLLWKAKGFNTLVFDVHGLAKMSKVIPQVPVGVVKTCEGCVLDGTSSPTCRDCIRGTGDFYAKFIRTEGR